MPLLFKSEGGYGGREREREHTLGHDSEFTVRVMILYSSSAPALTERVLSGGYIILPLHCWLCIARERGNINIDVRAGEEPLLRSANITRGKKAGGVTGQTGGNPVSVDWSN